MIFEMHQVIEDQPLRLANRVMTGDRLLQHDPSQVNAFDVIPHPRNAAKRTHPALTAPQFVSNAERALGLGTVRGNGSRPGDSFFMKGSRGRVTRSQHRRGTSWRW
jgi:hypothetical protein